MLIVHLRSRAVENRQCDQIHVLFIQHLAIANNESCQKHKELIKIGLLFRQIQN